MNDLEFIQRCVRAEREAWDEFVDKYSRLIYNYIYSVLQTKGATLAQENINDLFQEIFLSLVKDNFKKLKSFKAKNNCSFASWLRQVVINATIDYIRKLKPVVSLDEENEEKVSLQDILPDDSPFVRDTIIQEEVLLDLTDCISRLDNDDKYFLELHMQRDLSLEEIKDLLRVSRGAVDMRKSRLIEKLRECFKSKGFQLDF